MEFKIKICNIVINIRHSYDFIRKLCVDYMASKEARADFSVSTTKADIDEEKKMCAAIYPDGVYEATCLHREIVRGFVKYGVILMHSAVVAVDGKAYVFMAKSGVGKSTHIKLWREVFGEKAVVVNGDKPFFSFENGVFTAHGSPWRGKEGLGVPISVPVCGICFLSRGEVNTISAASQSETVDKLLQQVLLPKEREALAAFMEILNRVLESVPFYNLQCNMDKQAAIVAYDGMRKDKAQ